MKKDHKSQHPCEERAGEHLEHRDVRVKVAVVSFDRIRICFQSEREEGIIIITAAIRKSAASPLLDNSVSADVLIS